LKSVLQPWAAKKHGVQGRASTVAQEVANGLKWSFDYSPVRNIQTRREWLTQEVTELASISAELALLKEISQPDFVLAADVLVSQRQKDLEAQITI